MNRTLHMMIQGEGLMGVEINESTTILEVAETNGWTDFGFTVDDIAVSRDNWGTTTLWNAQEVWAVKGAKGA